MQKAEMGKGLEMMLKSLKKGTGNLSVLAKPIGQILLDDNRNNLGTDWHGNTLAPLAESTLKRREGNGPPLAPRGTDSRIVTNAFIDATRTTSGLVVELGWKGIPWLRFHTSGTKWMPQRDITGVRPQTMDKITDLVQNYYADLVSVNQMFKQ
ncbi:hypothetical protein ACYOEI_00045 [Singulisphaera rosea]